MQGFLVTVLSFIHIVYITVIFQRLISSQSNRLVTIFIDILLIIGRKYLQTKLVKFSLWESIMIAVTSTLTYSFEQGTSKSQFRWISWVYFIKFFDVWRSFEDIRGVISMNKDNPKVRLLIFTLIWAKYLLLSTAFFKIYKLIYQKLLRPYEDIRMFTFFVALSLLFCIQKQSKKQKWLKISDDQAKI